MACRISLLRKREKLGSPESCFFSKEKKDSELCGLDSELGSLEKGKLLLGKKIKQERDGNYNIQGADSRFILSEWRVLCLEFLKARVDLHYVCIVSSYDPIFVMLSTIPYTALLSPHSNLFQFFHCCSYVLTQAPNARRCTHYTLHSTFHTLHCFAWPHSNLFEFFQCFSYVLTLAPNARQGPTIPYTTLFTLFPPPTFTLQTPVLNLTPIFSSYSSSSIAFLLFWPPQCTSMHGPGGNRTPPSPNCHLVHWPQNRPPWPPQMVGELPQIGWFRHAAPQTPYSHFVRNEQLQPSLTAGFRNLRVWKWG